MRVSSRGVIRRVEREATRRGQEAPDRDRSGVRRSGAQGRLPGTGGSALATRRQEESVDMEEWAKDLAFSSDLPKWYGHDPRRFATFARQYRRESGRSGGSHSRPCEPNCRGGSTHPSHRHLRSRAFRDDGAKEAKRWRSLNVDGEAARGQRAAYRTTDPGKSIRRERTQEEASWLNPTRSGASSAQLSSASRRTIVRASTQYSPPAIPHPT